MLTIFSLPKPFLGHIGIIQRNAIRSWSHLRPACEIILCGDEPGTEEIAAEFKAKCIPNIMRNEHGTPLLNSVFDQVGQVASYELMCYVNADIILLNDFIEAVQRIQFRRFLMVGQRWDIELRELWKFDGPYWEEQIRRYVAAHGTLHPPAGSDYFVFPRDSAVGRLPAFAVGRPGWDNWFIYNARKLRVPVVDATKVITVIHQNHDYSHVPSRKDETSEGPEAESNRKLAGGWDHIFTLLDATHEMTPTALLPALGYKYLRRRWQTLPILIPAAEPLVRLFNLARARLRCRRWPQTSL
jgi:hypothetical protein